MEDDAVGLFDCPYCGEEFEWGEVEEEPAPKTRRSRTNYIKVKAPIMPDSIFEHKAWRLSLGISMSVTMGIFALYYGLAPIYVAAVLSDVGFGSLGTIFLFIGVFLMAFFGFGIQIGIDIAKGKFWSLIVGLVYSSIIFIAEILFWLNQQDQCEEYEMWTDECIKEYSAPFPFIQVIIWTIFIGMTAVMIFNPNARYHFKNN